MAIAIPAPPTLLRSREKRMAGLPKDRALILNWLGVSLILVLTVIAVAVPLLAPPHDPLVPVGMPLQAPGKNGFLLGTDSVGRDILSRVLFGVRSSWFAALVVVGVGAAHRWSGRADRRRHRRLDRRDPDANHRRFFCRCRLRYWRSPSSLRSDPASSTR